ncbi:MAG: hypothetical protein MZU84_06820 [Sphingobacterium sp.]|nr:hypothetical protein [Sphingobacterium sp.]
MKKKRNIWLVAGAVILLTALVSAFVIMQPSAKDILVKTPGNIQNDREWARNC